MPSKISLQEERLFWWTAQGIVCAYSSIDLSTMADLI